MPTENINYTELEPMAMRKVVLGRKYLVRENETGHGFELGTEVEVVYVSDGDDEMQIKPVGASDSQKMWCQPHELARKPRKRRVDAKPEVIPTGTIKQHEIIGQEFNKRMLELAIKKNIPALLVGETGTGKTSMVREQAINAKKPYTRFNLTGETTVDEFVGKYELEAGKTVWRDGILLQAMKSGQWLVVDEINMALPEILTVLHSLLDDDRFVVVAGHEGEVVKPHDDFRFFATMNPTDEYAGTKELNKAFQSRFSVILDVEYPSPKVEAKILADKTGIDQTTANKIADVALALRTAKKDEKIFYTCSTRDLLHWAHLLDETTVEDAFIVAILNKSGADRKVLVEIYDKIFGKYIKLESGGYTLTIDFFESAAKKIDEEKAKFEDHKEKVRKEITEDIIKKLTGGSVTASSSKPEIVNGEVIERVEAPSKIEIDLPF